MDVLKLKAAMVLAQKNSTEVAAACGISRTSWVNKLYGRSEFTVAECRTIKKVLNLDDKQTMEIFFDN